MTTPHFAAAAIAAATPWPKLIEALRVGFTSPHRAPDRHIHELVVPGARTATALLMPAWIEGEIYGVKLANIFPGNGALGLPSVSSLYVVFDGSTGQLRATMDGGAITVRRTAATSALASAMLSRPGSRRLLMLGAGRMAPLLISAHAAVRPIEEVWIWARKPSRAEGLAAELQAQGGRNMKAVPDLDAAIAEADIISSATLSREPLIKGALLRPGTHLDLVGAYAPLMRETDGDAVARAEVFIDTPGGARAEAGDLIQAIAEGRFGWFEVRADLAALCAGRHPGRTGDTAITLFKSVGAAIEDLAAARLVLAAQ
ncbi:MAG: bifunctional Delta(1)-pyrroline-2-carboxylate/Delta(1)-piperideine-2-carboxylate reductase [Devosia sp.]